MAAATEGKMLEAPSEASPADKAYTAESSPIVVISEQFITPYPVDLNIQHTLFTISENNFDITDDNGNPIFKVKDKLFRFPYRRILSDEAGNALVSLKKRIPSVHKRWKVFRGESEKSSDYLFSVKRSSVIQRLKMKTKATLDVFLASNHNKSLPDFRIKEGWRDTACTIFAGDYVIAQMQRKDTEKNLVINADNYGITAYPNVDYAFIVALVVILDEINRNGADVCH